MARTLKRKIGQSSVSKWTKDRVFRVLSTLEKYESKVFGV